MLPAGKITNSVLDELSGLCKKGDIVIDGGNSDHRDSLKTAKKMEEKGIYSLILEQVEGFTEQDTEQVLCVEEIRKYLKMIFRKC